MKECPRCESAQAWELGDGRSKCRACGRRYSWKSVWDSVRLPESAKNILLDAFVRGVPAAQTAADQACTDSRERFYRLMRASCAKHERVSRDGLSIVHCQSAGRARRAMRGWSTSDRVLILGIGERDGHIQIAAHAADVTAVLPLLRERVAIGGVIQLSSTQAYACLQIQGDYVSVPKAPRAPLALQSAEEFWQFTREHLQIFRKIPLKFFQLHLAEACLRFNHRGQDVHALLREFMTTTAIGEVKKLLLGETARTITVHDGHSTSANLNRNSSCVPSQACVEFEQSGLVRVSGGFAA